MQTNTVLYVVGAVVVIGLGAAAWMFMGKGTSDTSPTATTTSQTSGGQTTSLKSLLASQSPQRCTFTTTTDSSNSSGTVFVAGGKMRGDFTSTANEKTIESHMIVQDNTSYVWSDALPSGIKMAFNAEAQEQASQNGSVDVNAQVDYSCSGWSTDPSMFTLPANVEFRDITTTSGGVTVPQSSATQIHASQCAACANAGDATQVAQCKAMLSC